MEMEINVEGKKVLDIGCGPGQLLVELSKDGPQELCGVDIDGKFLRVAAMELKSRNIHDVKLIIADAIKLPFSDEHFDIVISFLTLPYVKDDKKALTEFSRVVKRDGTLVISGHEKGFPIRYVKRRRFKPLLIYIASLMYLLSGKKFILNTLQSYKKLCKYLTQIGISIEQITLSKKSFGLLEEFKIKGIKT
jgi:ubiquinone/menaquinone biosynthesis C-methylase UbiE